MNDLYAVFGRLTHPKVLVLGDLILDRYISGDANRVSPEAPVLVLTTDCHEARLGGAASVGALLVGLEAGASVAGVVGDDSEGRTLLALLDEAKIDRAGVICDSARPTTLKERFVGRAAHRHPHQILRVDHESREPLRPEIEERLSQLLVDTLPGHDIVLISDYAKGVCTPTLLGRVIETARRHKIPVLVDPARISDYARYRGASLLCPNRAEAELATGMTIHTPSDAIEAGRRLFERCHVKAVLVKLDRDGMVLVQAGGPGRHFATHEREVYDVTGAGDMVLAMLGLCRGSGLFWAEAVQLANVAAGLEVEKLGVAPLSRADIAGDLVRLTPRHRGDKRVTLPEMTTLTEAYRRQGKKVVFTNGCLDLLHLGHVTYLLEAAEQGDVLIVAVNSDASVRRLKGEGRPVMNENDRAALVGALECVDHVLVFDDDTPHDLLQKLQPDVLVKGGTTDEIVAREIVEGYGGRVCRAGAVPDISTTRILELLREFPASPQALAL